MPVGPVQCPRRDFLGVHQRCFSTDRCANDAADDASVWANESDFAARSSRAHSEYRPDRLARASRQRWRGVAGCAGELPSTVGCQPRLPNAPSTVVYLADSRAQAQADPLTTTRMEPLDAGTGR